MRLTVGKKLIAAFASVLALLGIVGYLGISNVGTMNGLLAGMYGDHLIGVAEVADARASLQNMLLDETLYATADQQADKAKYEQEITRLEEELASTTDKLRQATSSQTEKDELAKLDASFTAYKTARDQYFQLLHDGKNQEALDFLHGSLHEKAMAVDASLANYAKIKSQLAEKANLEGQAVYESTRTVLIAILAVAILAGVGLALFLSKVLSGGISALALAADHLATSEIPKVVQLAEAIANGDLTQSLQLEPRPVTITSADELGDAAKSLNKLADQLVTAGLAFDRMTAGLRNVVGQLRENAESVAASGEQLTSAAEQAGTATKQVATTIQEVAKGSTEQAKSMQEITQSMGQLKQAIEQVARGAQEQTHSVEQTRSLIAQVAEAIDQIASEADKVAGESADSVAASKAGAQTVQKTVKGMEALRETVHDSAVKVEELGQRSQEIGQIVDTISDIAEQTNLLALNAAIEAARAGDHGKGFAVVADEVRKLAERSSRATKEIAELIRTVQQVTTAAVQAMEAGVQQAEEGSALAAETGQSMQQILEAAQSSASRIQGISASLQQMARRAAEVVQNMESVSAVVQENTASTEEMASSADEVARSVEAVNAVVEENTASVEEISAMTEEMAAQVQQVSASAESVAQLAVQVREAVAYFQLEEEAQRQPGPEVVLRRRKSDWEKPPKAAPTAHKVAQPSAG